MNVTKLPAILHQPKGNSLSIERVLRRLQHFILQNTESKSDAEEHEIEILLDDLDIMLANIERDAK